MNITGVRSEVMRYACILIASTKQLYLYFAPKDSKKHCILEFAVLECRVLLWRLFYVCSMFAKTASV